MNADGRQHTSMADQIVKNPRHFAYPSQLRAVRKWLGSPTRFFVQPSWCQFRSSLGVDRMRCCRQHDEPAHDDRPGLMPRQMIASVANLTCLLRSTEPYTLSSPSQRSEFLCAPLNCVHGRRYTRQEPAHFSLCYSCWALP